MVNVVLKPGAPEGLTGRGSVLNIYQKAGPQLKDWESRDRTRDSLILGE